MGTCLRCLFVLGGMLCLVLPLWAGETVVSLEFSKGDLSFTSFEGHSVATLKECAPNGEIGAPGLPVLRSYVAIPGNMLAYRVEILQAALEEIPGTYDIYPQQIPLRISGTEVHPFQKNMAIYQSSLPYPAQNVELLHQADLGGNGLAGVSVCPFIYYPAEGRLLFISHIEFAVYTVEGWETGEPPARLDEDSAVKA